MLRVTRGSTYENRANLAPGFFDQIIRKYEGTQLGRQELKAEPLEDTPRALWSHAMIDAARLAAAPHLDHPLQRGWYFSYHEAMRRIPISIASAHG
jgi:phage terminase large subunit-like protein